MIVINVTEWIVDLLICGVAVVVWSIGIFMIAMLVSMASEWVEQLTKKGERNGKTKRFKK